MLQFFAAKNQIDPGLVEVAPWEFNPAAADLARLKGLPKLNRRAVLSRPSTVWQVYTAVRTGTGSVVSNESPPVAVRGFVVDYDHVVAPEVVFSLVNKLPEEYQPQYIEQSLGDKWRLVWVFEREVLVAGSSHCHQFFELFCRNATAATILPGYDSSSTKPAQRWVNGAKWWTAKKTPVPSDITHGIAIEAAKKAKVLDSGAGQFSLELIAAEIQQRWPGRWQGEFKQDSLGVRFWDDTADNSTGCQVKPDGMLCFTGPHPFRTWADIFGIQWVREQTAKQLGKAADGIYFDGHDYWRNWDNTWWNLGRNDVVLALKTAGISDRVPKGETASDVDHVMAHIQTANRIHGASPCINYRPGVIQIADKKILNISSLRSVQPADNPVDWPWIRAFLEGHFAEPDRQPLAHFYAWLQRSYKAIRDYRPLMGQAVFLCGPKHNGKTLLMERIVKPLLGGLSGNPFDWFCGRTRFNEELFNAFLWAIHDEESPTDQERKKFLARLKASVVNVTHTYEPKFCSRVVVEHTGRLVVTLNDGPQDVGMLPEVNGNTYDKMMFFRSQEFRGTWGTNQEIEETISRELPGFARWLLDWEPPEGILERSRVGVASYFDPQTLELSRQQMHHYNLRELLVIWVASSAEFGEGCPTVWEGTPSRLMASLSGTDTTMRLAQEWKVSSIAKALTALARTPDTGVELVTGSDRVFKIDSTKLK